MLRHALVPALALLSLAACSKTETTPPADTEGDTTIITPTATETAVVPGATSTVAVPVPGPTETSTVAVPVPGATATVTATPTP